MATDNAPARAVTPFEKAGLLAFAISLILYFFVSETAGTRGFGAWLVLFALALHTNGRIEFWISDQPGGRNLTGPLATAFNVVVAITGLAVLIWPEVAMAILQESAK